MLSSIIAIASAAADSGVTRIRAAVLPQPLFGGLTGPPPQPFMVPPLVFLPLEPECLPECFRGLTGNVTFSPHLSFCLCSLYQVRPDRIHPGEQLIGLISTASTISCACETPSCFPTCLARGQESHAAWSPISSS